jgi:hypothetical protein
VSEILWINDITRHIPAARYTPTHLNINGFWEDERHDKLTGTVICKPQPYPLLEALGDQIKAGYIVADDYRARLAAALLAPFDQIKVAPGTCELRLLPTSKTYYIIHVERKLSLRQNFPSAQAEMK